MFQPEAGLVLEVDDERYRVAGHPAMPKVAYGQEGKQAVVFKVEDEQGKSFALKVFKPRYRKPYLMSLAERMRPYSRLVGMEVCERKVIHPIDHDRLLQKYPDLIYAVLMPWIEGPTWSEILLARRPLEAEESVLLARCLLKILISLEEKGLSHGDISGMNVMIPYYAGGEGISLVDVEQLYIPGMEVGPGVLVGQSPGYSFPHITKSTWGPHADRFSGAVLLVEMLCYCEKDVVKAVWGESYFAPEEMGRDVARYRLIEEALEKRYGEKVASLFRRTWFSKDLESCPTLAEWYIYLPEKLCEKALADREEGSEPGPVKKPARDMPFGSPLSLQVILDRSSELLAQGDLRGVAELYQYALAMDDTPQDTRQQLETELRHIRAKLAESGGKSAEQAEADLRAEVYPAVGHLAFEVKTPAPDEVEDASLGLGEGSSAATFSRHGTAAEETAKLTEAPNFLIAAKPAPWKKRGLVVGLSMALILVVVFLALFLWRGREPENKVKVPELIGLTLEEARSKLAEAGLEPGYVSYEASEEIEEGRVIASDPSAGSLLDGASRVNLVVSGSELIAVPEVGGIPLEEVKSELQALGLTVEVEYRNSDSVQAGVIMGTEPPPGSQVAKGASIKLIVSSGTTPPQTVTQTCPTCGGAGEIKCSTCGGKGYISVSSVSACQRCGGRGFVNCTRCGGSGFLPDGRVCDLCSGRGTIICPTCGGSGKATISARQTCSACGGTGATTCPTCHGTGKIP